MNNNQNINPLDEKLTIKDLDAYSSVASKNNFINMKHQMRKLIDFKRKSRFHIGFFTPIIFMPLLMGSLALPAPHAILIFVGIFFMSLSIMPFVTKFFNNKFTKFMENKESYRSFQKDIIEMLTHPNNSAPVFNTLSKLANNIDNLKDKEDYLYSLHDFLNHIIDKKITINDIEFFINQDSILKDLSMQKNEEHKIQSFLQQLKQSNKAAELALGAEQKNQSTYTIPFSSVSVARENNNKEKNKYYLPPLDAEKNKSENQPIAVQQDNDTDDIYLKLQQVKEKFSQHI